MSETTDETVPRREMDEAEMLEALLCTLYADCHSMSLEEIEHALYGDIRSAIKRMKAHLREVYREQDEARQEVTAVREEARRLGALLVEYHDVLHGMVDEFDPGVLSVMAVTLTSMGRTAEAKACALLARWPEVKP